jgi:hypothetical protein
MDAASGSQPARGENGNATVAHGVMVGPLKEVHPDRIVVGSYLFSLRDGVQCSYPPGTRLQVVFVEQGGQRQAESLSPVKDGQ